MKGYLSVHVLSSLFNGARVYTVDIKNKIDDDDAIINTALGTCQVNFVYQSVKMSCSETPSEIKRLRSLS